MAVGPVAGGRAADVSTPAAPEPTAELSARANAEPAENALMAFSRRQNEAREARSVKGPPPPLFVNGVNMRDVRQLDGNTCYFLTTIAALARTRPEVLAESVKDLGGGRFDVRFFGARNAAEIEPDVTQARDNSFTHITAGDIDTFAQTLRIDAKKIWTAKEGAANTAAMRDSGGSPELWVGVLENAWRKTVTRNQGADKAQSMGLAADAFFALTGRVAPTLVFERTGESHEHVWQRLASATANNDPVVAGTKSTAVDHQPQHAYAVLAAREQDGRRTVTLYETGEAKETEISYDDFMRDFGSLTTLR